ncbi:DmsE family decaheme c-type cytochrome [Rhodopseudomonas sp. HC1]|uniref:DmsE family decaheme c-type cytochrome n=1 Tax=Rhodopseudomonas infernalis TaxID=2897386 RepID=UPI001EE9030E|nr:DmsE family decaheme c-type cytochrome [Rhodopseudomonas infernalis]MCG6206506.1 DmsE family decaheme c-type cytochrome [Rhodopseudomonas infernalis]
MASAAIACAALLPVNAGDLSGPARAGSGPLALDLSALDLPLDSSAQAPSALDPAAAAGSLADPTVDALIDYAHTLKKSGQPGLNYSPVPADHGLSTAAASAHAGIMPHGSSGSSRRFATHFSGHAHAKPSLKLPETAELKRLDTTLQLVATFSIATTAEQRVLRFHETRKALAAMPARAPDFALQMQDPRDDTTLSNWVAIENFDDSIDRPQRFDFVQILAGKGEDWQPILIAAQKQPKAAAGSRAPMVAPAPGDPDGRYFVGSKPCETCHAGLFDEFQQTVMGRNIKSGKMTPQGKMECETCHGPGSGHVNGGGGREKGGIRSFRLNDSRGVDIAEYNGVCLTCHEKGDQTYWQGSPHESRGLACVSCHTVMRKTSPRNQLKTPLVMDTCFQCHKDRKAQLQRTSHMPIRENKITCVNCHNPHGSATEKLLREATVNDVCYTCHADKRGPFLFEHPPVRENCLNCHEPHGSNHEALLVVARPRLCQQCHTNPHNQPGLGAASMRYQVGNACQNCHTNIHGSNSPSGGRWHR